MLKPKAPKSSQGAIQQEIKIPIHCGRSLRACYYQQLSMYFGISDQILLFGLPTHSKTFFIWLNRWRLDSKRCMSDHQTTFRTVASVAISFYIRHFVRLPFYRVNGQFLSISYFLYRMRKRHCKQTSPAFTLFKDKVRMFSCGMKLEKKGATPPKD